ncbi:uncharacterized protein LOC114575539 [Exaiptasia diaphana]|uniref:Transposase n=1 Tax=Exaiptasia diaphana TaxID=2652724 RepID=A0A913YPF7_EXADI|nr:uncharacterized protein LOC114575539 [Exaiptasia diaphana]
MECEGIKRSLEKLKKLKIKVHVLVTDRHLMIAKYIRENWATIKHFFDVWHVAKGLKKKLTVLGNKKGNELVHVWIKSITNHLYWVADSSNGDDGDLALAKWESLAGHLQNRHARHPNKLYRKCTHPKVKRKWFKPGVHYVYSL